MNRTPTHACGTPLNLAVLPPQLEYLAGSYMLTQIEDRKQHIAHDYEILCSVAPELREIADFETFSWARMMVRETSLWAGRSRKHATRSCLPPSTGRQS